MKETTPKYIILNFLKLGIKKRLKAGKEKNIICKEDDIIFLIRYNASVKTVCNIFKVLKEKSTLNSIPSKYIFQ